ncbi:MAG: Fis family transcriptional regulator [Desulfitibacter sp. BRH_c19]|nr:MAG: Fis family transcriptional regulator [Desulfitibacter sp. BRH_c19]
MDEKKLLSTIIDALPLIASITGGYATVTNSSGIRLITINSKGKEVKDFAGTVYSLAQQGYEKQNALIGPSQIEEGAKAWVLPVGPYVVCASNSQNIYRENTLKEAIDKSLPLIARVAGGEAVLFDKTGKRLASFNPDGTINKDYLNKVSNAAKQAMELQEPVIGESFSYEGAMAVRIPITREYGIGFNNELAVRKNQKLYDEVKKFQYARYNFSDIIGQSPQIQQAISLAKNVVDSTSTILIYGETGTGKELFAQSIHNDSVRRNNPFIALNCGALPSSLIESNLFGYVEGAFTGAKKGGTPGAFEQADGGTIFLDEISEMEQNLQTKLLRVLQEREVTRIGGKKPIRVNVRVIASTNKDLADMVDKEKFRSDLYFRLNVLQLNVPALRMRSTDVPFLVNHFIKKYNSLLGKYILEADKEVLDILQIYNWPGNVRELQNCIEHAINIVKINESRIRVQHLPPYISRSDKGIEPQINKRAMYGQTLEEILTETERNTIKAVLEQVKYKKKEAAKILGISTTTLWRKISQHNLQA